MENGLKALLIAAGAIVTILVIGIGISFYQKGKQASDSASDSMDQMTTVLNESTYTDLEGRSVFGNEVQSKVNAFANTEIAVEVITATSTTWYNYSDQDMSNAVDANTNSANISSCKQKTATNYINPNAKFNVSLYRDANGTIKAVIFTQQ